MPKERNTRCTFGFSISGHSPPIEPQKIFSPCHYHCSNEYLPDHAPFSPCSLLSTTLSPFAAALPGIPPYECITKRISFPSSMRGCSDSYRIYATSLAAVATCGLSQFKQGSARQWVSNLEFSRMVKTFW